MEKIAEVSLAGESGSGTGRHPVKEGQTENLTMRRMRYRQLQGLLN